MRLQAGGVGLHGGGFGAVPQHGGAAVPGGRLRLRMQPRPRRLQPTRAGRHGGEAGAAAAAAGAAAHAAVGAAQAAGLPRPQHSPLVRIITLLIDNRKGPTAAGGGCCSCIGDVLSALDQGLVREVAGQGGRGIAHDFERLPGCWPLVRIFLDAHADEISNLLGALLWDNGRMQPPARCKHAGHNLPQTHAKTKNVNLDSAVNAQQHLRSRIGEGAHRHSVLRVRLSLVGVHEPGHADVTNLGHFPPPCEQDVEALQVAVHHVNGVQVRQAARYVQGDAVAACVPP
mmetsp:Transcript_11577/g.34747  ORF Transcript_11577/g.34747 Transcript_11577/m.34747 type:complete len:286 (+) Transcript_11577:396-1253(+)